MRFKDVEVVTKDGYKSGERPDWLIEGRTRTRIERILDRWYEGSLKPGPPTVAYFKAELADGRMVLLRHVPLFDRWAMVLPKEERPQPSPPPRPKAKIIPFPR